MKSVQELKKRFAKNPASFFAPTEKGKIVHPTTWWVAMHQVAPFKEKLFWDAVREARQNGRASFGLIRGNECVIINDGWQEEL